MLDIKFYKGMAFNTTKYFKYTVIKYSATQRYNMRFVKNKASKVEVKYIFNGYSFII